MRSRVRELASRLKRNERAPERAPADQAPCVPCQQKQGVRQFSLNEPEPPVPDDFVPVLHTAMAYTVLDGQVVLHDPLRDASHVLNPGAALVWASIDDQLDTVGLVAQIARDTGEAVDTIDRDVRVALAHFISAGIVLPRQPLEPVRDPAADAAHEQAALEREHARHADELRRAKARRRVEPILKRQHWCSDVGPRQVGGTSVLVRSTDPAMADHLNLALQSLPVADAAETTISVVVDAGKRRVHRCSIVIDREIRVRRLSVEQATDQVLTQLNLLAIGNTPGKMLFHGGAVERDGTVIALLGVSGQGKSTLTAALVERGWNYVTDELVIVDPATFSVDPFPKALDLSQQSLELLGFVQALPPVAAGKLQVPPSNIGSVSKGGRLGLLVMLVVEDEEVANPPEPSLLPPVESLQQLMMNTFRETMALPSALDRQAELCASVPAIALTRTSVARSCALIEQATRLIQQPTLR